MPSAQGSEDSYPPNPDPRDEPLNTQSTSGGAAASAARAPSPVGVIAVLRQVLADGAQSPDAVIRAAAESARALTGADGIAIALRARGAILCRARSGDLAPDLGSQLNAHTGFSGECVRTASILLCDDAMNDERVDPEVCRMMGIRSIVAVPLRGSVGIAGILEAFSKRPGAFAHEQINALRELASIAETAYETERRTQEEETMASLRSSRRLPALFTRTVAAVKPKEAIPAATNLELHPPETESPETESMDSSLWRRYWVIGISGIALLLFLGVWLSWRTPVAELPATQAAAPPEKPVEAVPKPSASVENPKVGAVRRDDGRGKAGSVLKQAAKIEPASDTTIDLTRGATTNSASAPAGSNGASGSPATSVPNPEPPTTPKTPPASETATNEPPPSVTIAEDGRGSLSALALRPGPLPTTNAEVSQGVTQGQLIHKVDPVYPLQARALRIAGAVELEITIAQNGTVRDVKSLSGDPILITAATDAVRRWRYRPILLNGKPVVADKKVTVIFRLP